MEQLLKTGRFINVTLVETGTEPPADADVVLSGKIEKFKKGNRAARYMVPGLGATSIKAHVEFIDPATKTPLCQDDVHGKVIIGVFGGDSKGATNGMAKGSGQDGQEEAAVTSKRESHPGCFHGRGHSGMRIFPNVETTGRRRFESMQKMISLLTIAAIAGSHPAAAAWHDQSGQLPGLVSGKSIAITAAAVGGGVVAAAILFKKFHHKDEATNLVAPASLNMEGSEATLVLHNRGRSAISLSAADFKGRGFEFTAPLKLPVVVHPNNNTEIPVRMTGGRNSAARIDLHRGWEAAPAHREPARQLAGPRPKWRQIRGAGFQDRRAAGLRAPHRLRTGSRRRTCTRPRA